MIKDMSNKISQKQKTQKQYFINQFFVAKQQNLQKKILPMDYQLYEKIKNSLFKIHDLEFSCT